jgi:hypothetical protein
VQYELENLLEVVFNITEELYTGTHLVCQKDLSHHCYRKKCVPRKHPNILQVLECIMDYMSKLTVGLDAFSNFAPEVASGHIKTLQTEMEVSFSAMFYSHPLSLLIRSGQSSSRSC